MPTIYEVYDGSNLSLKLINKTIDNSKQTSISLGDDNTKIYTKSTGTIQFTANLIIENDLTVGSSDNSKKFNVYNQLGVNTPTFYTNVSAHIKNGNNPITTPPPYTTQDLLLLENVAGSYLQLSSSNTTISGIGFSTTSARNRGSIQYNFSNNIMSFIANSNEMTFNGSTGLLTVNNLTVTENLTANTLSLITVGSSITANSLFINATTTSVVSPFSSVTANFTNTSIVIIKGMVPLSPCNITLTIPNTISPHRMRVIYLLVKSNGNYTINSTTTGGAGFIRLPSNYPINPSASGQYDMYSFLTNGQDAFCTFAYNYLSTGELS